MNCGDIPLHRPEKIGLFSMVGTSNQSDPGMAIDMRPGSSPKIVITSQLLFQKTARTRSVNHGTTVQRSRSLSLPDMITKSIEKNMFELNLKETMPVEIKVKKKTLLASLGWFRHRMPNFSAHNQTLQNM